MNKSTYLLVCVGIALCLGLACSIRDPNVGTDATTLQSGPKQNQQASPFCLAGCPSGAPAGDTIVAHHILELDNNPKTKFADWVAYRITADTLGHGCKRIWARDPDLPKDATLDPQAYRGAHEVLSSDRGHQAPLASLCGSPYWYEADYLSNITPQKTTLNEGPWEHLENGERNLIKDHVTDALFSITGPLYEREMPTLPYFDGEHKVPSAYWKVVSTLSDGHVIFVAFVMDQTAAREDDFCANRVSIQELEKRSHLHFFPALSAQDKAAGANAPRLLHGVGC